MVLTVTLNPLLEKKLYFHSINSKNRAYKEEYLAGGKGINVSRQLNLLGIQNHALTFLGGANGKRLRSIIESENISFSIVSSKSETREAVLIFDEENQKLQTFFGINSEISDNEINQFLDKLEKSIVNSSIVVFSGSVPNKECSIIIEKGIELCHKHDKISILDTYGDNLNNLLKLGPTVVHNNLNELKSSLSINLNNEENIVELLKQLYDYGIKLAFLTSGEKDIYAAKSDFHYKISTPKINEKDSTGSGDAFVSGIIYGLENSLVFSDFVKLAAALGAENAQSWETCRVSLKNAQDLLEQIKIFEIGKKIKLINDSPTI